MIEVGFNLGGRSGKNVDREFVYFVSFLEEEEEEREKAISGRGEGDGGSTHRRVHVICHCDNDEGNS